MVHHVLRSLWRRSRDVVDAQRWIPDVGFRYRDSWRSDDVARQMLALSESELRAPDAVAPFKAFRELLSVILDDPTLPLPARFLDIGCGVGVYGDLLERYAPGRFLYLGADYSEQIIDAARARAPSRTFEVRDILDRSALGGFDVVLAGALLDVMPEIRPALDRLLAADARWVILHRQRIDACRSGVAVVRGYRGQHTYRTSLTRTLLESRAAKHERAIVATASVARNVRSFLLLRT